MSINKYIKSDRINSQNSLEMQGEFRIYYTGPVAGASNIMHENNTGHRCGERIGFCDKKRLHTSYVKRF